MSSQTSPNGSRARIHAAPRKRVMAFMLARFNRKYERLIADRKRALLSDLSGNVLEIGPGTGSNLTYFSPHVRWVGIEPNPFMHPYLRRQAERLNRTVEIRDASAEQVPLQDNSVDAVVSTLVLCSVKDVSGALQEILRVLRPGGRFVFIEHGAAPPGTWLRRLQRWVRPVSRTLADGCCPDRETWVAIECAGFERVDCQHFRLPIPIVGPHIAGVAVKKAT